MTTIDERRRQRYTRRQAIAALAGGMAVSPRLLARLGAQSTRDTVVYIGTYTQSSSKGIYLFRLQRDNPQNATLVPLGVAVESRNPSFLELDAANRRLFAVNEVSEFDGKPTGAVSAFAIDPAAGTLTLVNQQPSMGTSPCHLVLDATRRHLLVANYGSGSVAVLPVGTDGRLGAASHVQQHTGRSVNPDRQRGPHAHCVTLDAANRFAFVCDLGLDKVMVYRFDATRGTLTPHDPPSAALAPGAGPRHMAFRPDGRFAYVLNELDSTLTTFAYDAQRGVLTNVQTVSTKPAQFDLPNFPAEVGVHPTGKWVYASNRGHDSVSVFAVDRDKGTLTRVQDQLTGGAKPRHFGVDPSGQYIAMANQDSDTILMARIDAGSGRLTTSGAPISVPSPVCVVFLPPPR